MSKVEFQSVCQALGGYEKLIDREHKDKDLLTLLTYHAEEDRADKLPENQHLIKIPIVRNGRKGYGRLSAGCMERVEIVCALLRPHTNVCSSILRKLNFSHKPIITGAGYRITRKERHQNFYEVSGVF